MADNGNKRGNESSHDARDRVSSPRTAPGTTRSVDSPSSSSPIPGPGASNVGATSRDGGSRGAGLDRDRGDLRNPGESDVMDSAISGEGRESPTVPEGEKQGSKRGDVYDPQPDRPDPEGIPRTGSDRTHAE